MRVAYFGPEGTFTQEALISATAGQDGLDPVPQPTIYDTVMAVHFGSVQRALVPIENSLEGSVNATLDALAMETEDVAILGEVIHPIRHCLIARTPLELSEIEDRRLPSTGDRSVRPLHPLAAAPRHRARGGFDRGGGAHGGRARRAMGGAREPPGRRALSVSRAPGRRGGRPRQRDPLRLARAARSAARRARVRTSRPSGPGRPRSSSGASAPRPPAGSCTACRSSPAARST